ncbi:MAG: hypothetical protein E7403_03370 [Ruminococcaceae bacterium]|nr:hypothetical protein [Oscillospiraceae bacterium]
MKKKARNLLKIGAIYLGTVLGAGFASGQELLLFFVRFSKRGLVGCFLAGVLFCLLGALILKRSYSLSEKNCKQYLKTVFPKGISSFLQGTMEVFLCISFCIMLSGAGAFFKERFSLSPFIGILVTDLICLLVFLYDLEGLSFLNLLLTPVMLLGTVYVCFFALFAESSMVWLPQVHPHGRFLPYALLYVGYNMLTATAVLVPTVALAESEKTAVRGGVLGGVCLSIMALLSCLALYFQNEVWQSALPMLLLSRKAGMWAYGVYSAVLYMAMLTTAVSTGFSVVKSVERVGFGKRKGALTVCLAALPLSFVEFSTLVRYCYVFFGILGLILIAGILWDWYKRL